MSATYTQDAGFGSSHGSVRVGQNQSSDYLPAPARPETQGVAEMLAAVAMVTGLDIEKDLIPVVRDGWFSGLRPVRALINAEILTVEDAEKMIAIKVGTIAIEPMSITTEAADMVPLWFCEQHNIVPVSISEGVLTVASDDNLRSLVKSELEEIVQHPVIYRLTSKESVAACVASLSTRRSSSDSDSSTTETVNESVANWEALTQKDDDSEISDHVVSLITRAVAMNASDIHIQTETTESGSTVVTSQLRRLGDLVPHSVHSLNHGYRLMNRLKVAGGFDVDPTKTCDGRYNVTIPGSGRYDLRLTGMPISQGQMLVIRMLPHLRKGQQTVSELFPAKYTNLAERMEKLLSQPEGMMLVVGSTGSGKSTTLAAMIRPLANNPALKVVTVEDPVENLIIGAQQVEVTKRLSFTEVLRGFLRSDPDAILVGEIRDTDTAIMATQAAQTGHIVLSTLHASTVELTPSRLTDMGVPRSHLADVLLGVLAQRLVKTLCLSCSSALPDRYPAPRGCDGCANTGWGNRIAIAELMEVNEDVASLIAENAPVREIRKAANIFSYSQFAAKLIDNGITTREAVLDKLGSTYDPGFETGVYTK